MTITPSYYGLDSGIGHGIPVGTPHTMGTATSAAVGTNGGPGTLSYVWSISFGTGGAIVLGSPNDAQHRAFTITNTIPSFVTSPKDATVIFQCVVTNATSGQAVTRTVEVFGVWHNNSGDP